MLRSVALVTLLCCITLASTSSALYQAAAISKPANSGSYSKPIVADVDGDGLNDILSNSAYSTSTLSWFKNLGNYVFQENVIVNGNHNSQKFAVADLDNDGDVDAVLWTSAGFAVIENVNWGASWATHVLPSYNWDPNHGVTTFTVIDYDNDGWVDIYIETFAKTQVIVYKNMGGLSFQITTWNVNNGDYVPYNILSARIPEMGGNTYPNVIVECRWSGDTGVYRYTGTTWEWVRLNVLGAYNGVDCDVGDLNGDGMLDVGTSGENCWNVAYVLNTGSSVADSWDHHPINTAASYFCFAASRLAIGDVDGNGDEDIAVAFQNENYLLRFPHSGSAYADELVFYSGYFAQVQISQLYKTGYNNQDIIYVDNNGITVFSTCPTCPSCGVGYYFNATGACVTCPAGYTSLGQGQVSCRACSEGYYSTAGSTCMPCPAGFYSNSGAATCTRCPTGTYGDTSGSAICTSCPTGTFSSTTGSTACTSCPVGKYTATAGASACTNCPTGKYTATAGSSSCDSCRPGTYTATAGASSCAMCNAGSYSATGASTCPKCVAGTWSSAGTSLCKACPPGTKGNGVGATTCTNCAAGFFSTGGANACTKCPAGKYGATAGAATCEPCLPGTFTAAAGATTCRTCAEGTFSCFKATACTSCPKGTYYDTAIDYCRDCPAGTYSTAGSLSCTQCPAGTFSAAVGASACTNCPSGKTSAAGAHSPLACYVP